MPRLDKTCLTQYAGTGCAKQLRVNLHPTASIWRPERELLDLPHPQVRPALAEITRAGNEWGEAKIHDLATAFSESALIGGARTATGNAATPGIRFAPSELATHLTSPADGGGVAAGQFLVEVEYDADTPTFRSGFGLAGLTAAEMPDRPLAISRARPDLIEVIAHTDPAAAIRRVTETGLLRALDPDDVRLQLRIIDVKLTSEPGPQYFNELAYYAVLLAAWLVEHHLDDRYVVHPDVAVWPGSEDDSALDVAVADGATIPARRTALHADLETVPIQVFLADVRRFLTTTLPTVLATPFADLEWAVTPRCQGCENLGQKFQTDPGIRPADWDPRHCLPTAEATQDLSRLPFLSRGSARVFRRHGVSDVNDVAQLDAAADVFDDHHRLRGQRAIIGNRADALVSHAEATIPDEDATSVAIPGWAKLRLHVTADFDPGSAITLAFGLSWAWLSSSEQLTAVPRTRVHYVIAKTTDAEWDAFAALLDDIAALATEAIGFDANAQMQLYVWDSVTFEHLTRVTGRHLGRVLGNRPTAHLGWLFPPDQLVASPGLVTSPAVSVVRDAARALVSMDLPHTYTLLETARRYYPDGAPNTEFWVPTFWSDPFTDQIPPERAHQLWRGRRGPNAPTLPQLMTDLQRTVRSKLFALSAVVDRLSNDLRGHLPRRSPKISDLRGPRDISGTSHLGLLLVVHAKLDAALDDIETSRIRALPVAEREAKFASARLTRRIADHAERTAWLRRVDIGDPGPYRQVFDLDPRSRDVSAKPGQFSWAVSPVGEVGLLDLTLSAFMRRVQDADLEGQWPNWSERRLPLSKILGVNIVHLDRSELRVVVDFEHWGSTAAVRHSILTRGHLTLDRDLVMDPVAIDVFTQRLTDAVTRIGNPPEALNDARIQTALGISRNPRRGAPHPVADFLWAASDTATSPIERPSPALRARLREFGYVLNDSQWDAWEAAMTRRLVLIWGPPGTGKTHTLRTVLAGLLEHATTSGVGLRVAVAAGTYTAVENVMSGLADRVDAHWPDVELRFMHSGSRANPHGMPDGSVVSTTEPAAVAEVNQRLDGAGITVVASTTQQIAKLLKAGGNSAGARFDVIVLDEAGQLDVGHALLAMAGAAPGAQLIVAGDPKQLPPIHAAEPPEGLEALVGSIYEFYSTWHNISDRPLLRNYRSNAEIVDLARAAGYPAGLIADEPGRRLQLISEVLPDPASTAEGDGGRMGGAVGADPVRRPPTWPDGITWDEALPVIVDPARPVVAVTYPEGESGQWNAFEADLVARLVTLLAHTMRDPDPDPDAEAGALVDSAKFWTKMVGVVTPHRAQRARVVELLTSMFVTDDSVVELAGWIAGAVDTVERFQGQEREVIVATYAVGDPDTVEEEAEFLHDMNRFNVLATRARSKVIVIASDEILNHTGHDLEVIRSSEMLKDFAQNFCAYQRRVTVHAPIPEAAQVDGGGADENGAGREVVVRWH
ncbi:AAA domain-containing protein [Janibacter melonis]|uniref:DEAD/DEAH box helicase n=1 Tax=Janibacter melonis TaxID=262209 RepID=UPI001786EDA8